MAKALELAAMAVNHRFEVALEFVADADAIRPQFAVSSQFAVSQQLAVPPAARNLVRSPQPLPRMAKISLDHIDKVYPNGYVAARTKIGQTVLQCGESHQSEHAADQRPLDQKGGVRVRNLALLPHRWHIPGILRERRRANWSSPPNVSTARGGWRTMATILRSSVYSGPTSVVARRVAVTGLKKRAR